MKFGVVIPIWRLTMADAERITLRAEELGWDGVFVPDHIMAKPATTQHYGPTWPDPFALLAFLAGRTRQIQVGASVIVLPIAIPLSPRSRRPRWIRSPAAASSAASAWAGTRRSSRIWASPSASAAP